MEPDTEATAIPESGQPIDPYADAIEDPREIRAAVDELLTHGYAVRVEA